MIKSIRISDVYFFNHRVQRSFPQTDITNNKNIWRLSKNILTSYLQLYFEIYFSVKRHKGHMIFAIETTKKIIKEAHYIQRATVDEMFSFLAINERLEADEAWECGWIHYFLRLISNKKKLIRYNNTNN